MSNQELSEELHKRLIRKFEKQKVHSFFIDNICSANLADLQLISSVIEEFVFYYVLLIFSVNSHGLFL